MGPASICLVRHEPSSQQSDVFLDDLPNRKNGRALLGALRSDELGGGCLLWNRCCLVERFVAELPSRLPFAITHASVLRVQYHSACVLAGASSDG